MPQPRDTSGWQEFAGETKIVRWGFLGKSPDKLFLVPASGFYALSGSFSAEGAKLLFCLGDLGTLVCPSS